MKMKKIDISHVEGFRIGNAENTEVGTGCTVIICEDGAVGGVDVRGGGPATRETDLLRSENTVSSVNAVILSGGSAFGLESGSGVMRALADRGVGFAVGDIRVPIVCGASLFDLAVGTAAFPDVEMGRAAVDNAYEGLFENGNHGAGTGATVGKLLGMDRAMKTGLGTFACSDGIIDVGAVAAVNAVADVYNGAGNIIAGLRTEDGSAILGSIKVLKDQIRPVSETLGPGYDDASEKAETPEVKDVNAPVAQFSREDIAKAIREAYKNNTGSSNAMTDTDEDLTPEIATPEDDPAVFVTASPDEGPAISEEEILHHAEPGTEPDAGPESEPEAEPESEPDVGPGSEPFDEPESEPDAEPWSEDVTYMTPDEMDPETREEMGYDISFNTTVACLVTNAKLTKPQANKLASILHDAYARAIKPVHSTLDGDTIFVLAAGQEEVNFDAFAALATDVMQYAIIDGAMSAESAYGLPAARDMMTK